MPPEPGSPAPSLLRRRLPNALTVFRLLLAVLFFSLISFRGRLENRGAEITQPDWFLISAAILFGLAAFTDVADGFLARRWNVITPFGRIMDPFADKVLIVGSFIYLAGPGFQLDLGEQKNFHLQASGVATWMAVVILGRELLVTSIRGVLEGQGIQFPASWHGKAKMLCQSLCVPLVLGILAFSDAKPGTPERLIIDAAVLITMGITIWSGVPYVTRAVGAFREAKSAG
jgi:CDP-diacylglycerol---glycerol-3-phosphate 3-phosphatidyltransferase